MHSWAFYGERSTIANGCAGEFWGPRREVDRTTVNIPLVIGAKEVSYRTRSQAGPLQGKSS
ncbi:hypothetical protein Taro_047716 [Colocasia esculenta]|uniref:Uncharacterized protein n=1 Tax=Colocasia esculenta TaxID=4460 RepID=A0A843WW65_COLES|nr:hypothetical protein [Colocasia esculenta]